MRRSGLRRSNSERRAKRYAENFAGPFKGYDHRERIGAMPCANASDRAEKFHGESQAAHVVPRSQGGCWYDTVPLCRMCHAVFEVDFGNDSGRFEERFGVSLERLARGLADEARRDHEVDERFAYCLAPGWQKLEPGRRP